MPKKSQINEYSDKRSFKCLLQDIAETFTIRMSRMGYCRDIAQDII